MSIMKENLDLIRKELKEGNISKVFKYLDYLEYMYKDEENNVQKDNRMVQRKKKNS